MSNPSLTPHPASSRRLALRRPAPRGLAAAALLCACLAPWTSCNKGEALPPAAAKGKVVYATYCIACHNTDPSKDGTLGPAVQASSLELLKARVIHGDYPPGYAPKRETKIMRKLPLTETDVQALHAFLNPP